MADSIDLDGPEEGVLRYHWRPARAFRKGRPGPVRSIVLHSTDGREAGDLETLTRGGGKSAHWYVTRDGRVFHLVADADTAYHAGKVCRDAYANGASIGIEQEHVDGPADWPHAQVLAVARIVAFERQKHGPLPVVSHAEAAAPKGRKIDPLRYPWELLSVLVKREGRAVWRAEQVEAEE